MDMYISETLAKIIQYSKDEAMRTGAYQISPGHLLLGILRHTENEACEILKACGVKLESWKDFLDTRLFCPQGIPYAEEDRITLSRTAENTLSLAMLEASMSGDNEVRAKHLLLALSRSASKECEALFSHSGISYSALTDFLSPGGKEEATGHSEAEAIESIKEELISVVEMLENSNKIFS